MTPDIDAPAANDDPTVHADWLEWKALTVPDADSSAQDLIAVLKQTGSSDALPSYSSGSNVYEEEQLDDAAEEENDELERVAEDALEQLAMRAGHLGDAYPFSLDGALRAKQDAVTSPYAFLTAISFVGFKNENAPAIAASLFEHVSAAALVQYLGGRGAVRSFAFGFPRRQGPKAFRDAVEELCKQMDEGGGCGVDQNATAYVKDAKLDVVAWVPFGDHRSNQLCVFGQCATGRDWRNKINELHPIEFCKTWLIELPAMNPLLAFFVPRQIEDRYWRQTANSDYRVLFDRLRIASLLGDIDEDLSQQCAAWTESAFN